MSDDSQFVVTLGRGGRVVKRAALDFHSEVADSGRVAGKKRSIKDRLGNGLNNTFESQYQSCGNDKRQRGESSQETRRNVRLHDSYLANGDLRLKLLAKNMSRGDEHKDPPNNMDLRDTLLRKTRQSAAGTNVISHSEPSIRARESVPERRDVLYGVRKSVVNPIEAFDCRGRTTVDPRDDYNGGRGRSMVNYEDHYDDRRRHVFEPQDFLDDRRRSTMEPLDKYGDDRQRMMEPSDIYGDGRQSMLRQVSSRNVHDLPIMDRAKTSHSARGLDRIDLRRRSPDVILRPSLSRVLSPERNQEELHRRTVVRAYDERKSNSYMPSNALCQSTAVGSTSLMMRSSTHAATSKPLAPFVSQFSPPSIGAQKILHPGEIPTVDGFLRFLGLEKYSINFKAEEVDMHALRQMTDVDLKEMGVPLGPRKKILQALLPRPKRQA